MAVPLIRWSDGAKNVLAAFRDMEQPEGVLKHRDALLAILFRTPPDGSTLSRVLRDRSVWPNLLAFVQDRMGGPSGSGFYVFEFETLVEEVARAQGSRVVGERHIAVQLLSTGSGWLAQFGIHNPERLPALTREAELGPGLDETAIRGRWHGLLDAVIIVQHQPVDQILWLEEVIRPGTGGGSIAWRRWSHGREQAPRPAAIPPGAA